MLRISPGRWGRLILGSSATCDVVDQHHAGAGVGADPDDGLDEAGDVHPGHHWQAEEPGELGCDHAGCRGGRDGDVEDRDAVRSGGVAGLVQQFVGPAELGDRDGLAGAGAGAGGAGDDQPSAGADRVPVQQDQARPQVTVCRTTEVRTTSSLA